MTIIMEHMEQGSREWLMARIGCITMSNASKLLTGGKGLTRLSYIIDVASEVITGVPAEEINTWAMQRGKLLEPYARDAYEAHTGTSVQQVGLGYLDDKKRIAASPDGLFDDGGLEIKCPGPKKHLRTILEGTKADKKTELQMQGNMWVFGRDVWDRVSFCPEFKAQPLFITRHKRNDETVQHIREAALKAVAEVDEYVAKVQSVVGDDVQAICDNAVELLKVMTGEDLEIK